MSLVWFGKKGGKNVVISLSSGPSLVPPTWTRESLKVATCTFSSCRACIKARGLKTARPGCSKHPLLQVCVPDVSFSPHRVTSVPPEPCLLAS